jgi:3-dehydro-L-gulonate 2-dehydrogenase
MEFIKVTFKEMKSEFNRILLQHHFTETKADKCAEIFAINSLEGIYSHGVYRFPRFVSYLQKGFINVDAEPEMIHSMGALEQWDGHLGPGPLNAEIGANRAMKIADKNGIGCVAIGNTNHWMRAGTYGLLAAEAGCIGICWTNTIANMPPWGAAEKRIGNNPLVVCVPRDDGPVLLDMAMSQFSFGKMEVFRRLGKKLPLPGGYDENGDLTTDPDAVLRSQRPLPIGYWKGSGLALVLDLMAVLISGGDSTKEISQRGRETGVSQVFMAIDIGSQPESADINGKVNSIIEDFLDAPPLKGLSDVRYPGQGMLAARKENLEKGIPVDPQLWKTIQEM